MDQQQIIIQYGIYGVGIAYIIILTIMAISDKIKAKREKKRRRQARIIELQSYGAWLDNFHKSMIEINDAIEQM